MTELPNDQPADGVPAQTAGNRGHEDGAEEGYRAAVQMVANETWQVWAVFSAMVAANALVILLVGSFLTDAKEPTENHVCLRRLVAGLGCLLCAAWFLITQRQFGFREYWNAWAVHYEPKAVGSKGMFDQKEAFSRGDQVKMNSGATVQLACPGKHIPVRWLIYISIGTFVVFYVLLAAWS